ncbi:putative receptor-like protein kinase [Arachis hypogaea]|nr:putative receptor-like protein kinase [Arachis hypogaea]
MKNQRNESDAEEERSSKRTPLLSSWVVSTVPTVALGDRDLIAALYCHEAVASCRQGFRRRRALPLSLLIHRRCCQVPSPSPSQAGKGENEQNVRERRSSHRCYTPNYHWCFQSHRCCCAAASGVRRRRQGPPSPRSSVKSNANGKENKEAANGDLGKWLCFASASRLLIFDNIENGSLKEHLNDPLKTPLNWRMRLQIANEVVAALEYLFLFNDPPAYHVSISSSNIMLDENFAAKIRKHFFSH